MDGWFSVFTILMKDLKYAKDSQNPFLCGATELDWIVSERQHIGILI